VGKVPGGCVGGEGWGEGGGGGGYEKVEREGGGWWGLGRYNREREERGWEVRKGGEW